MVTYKKAKILEEQIEYLKENKRVQFNVINEEDAKDILFKYNYINVITPYKHRFAKLNNKKEVIKVDGNHVYEKDVEFSEYYELYKNEHEKYSIIATNIMHFETLFNSILSYRILTNYLIKNDYDLELFLNTVKLNIPSNSCYNTSRLNHINRQIESLIRVIPNYHDVYCFFDRLTLGSLMTIFCGLDKRVQKLILMDCEKSGINFGVKNVNTFISKFFPLVSIRNCVMHCNSLEVLIRFYNPKTKDLRKSTDRKKYISMVRDLEKEKPHSYE